MFVNNTFYTFSSIYVKQIIYNMKKDVKIKMINIRIELDLNEKFQIHCKKNGYSISKRIRLLMEDDINGK